MNRTPRQEWNASRSMCIDDANRRRREEVEKRRADLVAQGLIDSGCRYARWDIFHVCVNRDDQPLRPWSTCHLEAYAQIREAEAAERAAAEDASDLAREPYVPPAGLPKYRYTDPRRA